MAINYRVDLPFFLVFVFCSLVQGQALCALPAAVEGEPLPSLAPMLSRVTPAVVNISTVTHIEVEQHPLFRDPFFRHFFSIPRERREKENQSLGSGVILDAGQGLVLTNHHVVDKAEEIEVRLQDGRELLAELVGSDTETDIALLRIPAQGLTAIPMADSDALRVGDFVVAVGSPFGLSQTVTSGIVSALGRTGLGIEGYESFIQTDASINPGNSGGPLVDLAGRLVGINTAILAPGGGNVGIGFAIPANMVRTVMDQLLEHGAVRRGLFGVAVQDLNKELAQALGTDRHRGAVVSAVEPESAAARAGLVPGDVITGVDGKPVQGAADLRNRIGLLRVGTDVELAVVRNGEQITIKGTVADPYADFVEGADFHPLLAGALLGKGEVQTARGRLPAVAIGPVQPETPAWKAGLHEGDLVLRVNRERVRDLETLRKIIAEFQDIHSLRIQRGDEVLSLSRR
jgi:Do/DeqQ family serine protease